MQNSIVVNSNGAETEVYLTELDAIVDEYIRDLDPETIAKPTTFLGILKHLYVTCFRPAEPQQYNSKSILRSAEDVSKLWDWYCSLAFRFGRTPTALQFGLLCGIDRHTLQDWKDGSTRRANSAYSTTAQKIKAESEAALENRAIESNAIGAIFGLKASHGWRETAPVSEPEMLTQRPYETPEQIMARYADIEKPELPVFDEEG